MGWLRRWWAQYKEGTYVPRKGLDSMGVPPPVPMPDSSPDDLFVDYDG